MASEWVYDLRGKEIVFTGKFDGYSETELTEIALKMGASRVKEWGQQVQHGHPGPRLEPPLEVRKLWHEGKADRRDAEGRSPYPNHRY